MVLWKSNAVHKQGMYRELTGNSSPISARMLKEGLLEEAASEQRPGKMSVSVKGVCGGRSSRRNKNY